MSFLSKLFKTTARHQLSNAETDQTFPIGRSLTDTDRDRFDYDRETILDQALEAWRVNPLARRIVGLTTQYVVGNGLTVRTKHERTNKFLLDFWHHRLNRMQIRTSDWADELTRSGCLFIALSTDRSGMSYVRAFPASQIKEIVTRPNDIETPVCFEVLSDDKTYSTLTFPAYDPVTDQRSPDGTFPTVMLYYPINRPVSSKWGESDLAPLLKWISRYSNWLEDRARLNRYRNSFLYVVKGTYANETERTSRQKALNACPPTPGSILVGDTGEDWQVLSPKLESSDANLDGQALKKMISAGSALPMHFLAEPEGSTKTTAEASGGPTYRHFEQRQRYFLWAMTDLLTAVVARRAQVDKHIKKDAEIQVTPADISGRDNVAYSMAANNIAGVLKDLRDRLLIDDEEYLRLVYSFINEPIDVDEMLKRGKAAPAPVLKGESAPIEKNPEPTKPKTPGHADPLDKQEVKIDPETGEPKNA